MRQPVIILLIWRLHLDSLYIHDHSAIIQRNGEHVWLKCKHRFWSRKSRYPKDRHIFNILTESLLAEKFLWITTKTKYLIACICAAYKIRYISIKKESPIFRTENFRWFCHVESCPSVSYFPTSGISTPSHLTFNPFWKYIFESSGECS